MVSIVRGDCYRTLAHKLCKIPDLNSELGQGVANSVRNECKSITKRDQSILQKTTPADMVTLSFKETATEIKEQMQTLYTLLDKTLKKGSDVALTLPGSLILWYNCKTMSRVQHTIGQILDISGATDEVPSSDYLFCRFKQLKWLTTSRLTFYNNVTKCFEEWLVCNVFI